MVYKISNVFNIRINLLHTLEKLSKAPKSGIDLYLYIFIDFILYSDFILYTKFWFILFEKSQTSSSLIKYII